MKKIFITIGIMILITLSACTQVPGPIGRDAGVTHTCTASEKAADVCTKEYRPVCGSDGNTYGNGCVACSADVDTWTSGECGAQKECGQCPQFMPPSPQFCEDGEIIPGGTDECGCNKPPQCLRTAACTEEAKVCPDGSAVGRVGPTCEFAPCPGEEGSDSSGNSGSGSSCTCPEGYVQEGNTCNPKCYYSTPSCMMPSIECTPELNVTACSDPRPEACTMQYDPVCGYAEQQVYCIRAPCPPITTSKTYGNSCTACSDENVTYWKKGECQE